ncbi:MAG: HEAT repeat domain-containing protein, partial [Rhodospirillales bacterium]|nr:HEAT repeat domain-containing protein [Rhodospirillales bacterium]
ELVEIVKRHVWPDHDIVTRFEAQERLAELGRQSPGAVVPVLVAQLSAPRRYGKTATHQRLALIETLRDIGPAAEAAVPVLIEVLRDPEEAYDSVKMIARMALGQIGTAEAEAAIVDSWRQEAEQRAQTTGAAELESSARQSAFLIRQELRRAEPYDDSVAAGLPQMKAAGRRAAVALPTLLRAYRDPRLGGQVRAQLAEAIRAMGVNDVAAAAADAPLPGEIDLLEDLIADVESPDDFIASLAIGELGKLGPSARALEVLIAALDQGRSPGAVANALGEFGGPAAPAVPHLVPYLADRRVGANAIQAVGTIGRPEAGAVTELRRIARTSGEENRGMAATALSQLGAREALPDLAAALSDPRKYTRILAAKAVGRFGEDAAAAVADLEGLLVRERDADVRRAAIEALGRIGPAAQSAAPSVARDLESGDRRLRTAAEQALAKIGGPVAEDAVAAGRASDLASDQVAARRYLAGGDHEGLGRYLDTLADERGLVLARSLGAQADPETAFVGAAYLLRRGPLDEAVPRMAEILLAHDQGPELLTGIAWSLMHSGDETRDREAMASLVAELTARLETAPPEQRTRFQELIAPPRQGEE